MITNKEELSKLCEDFFERAKNYIPEDQHEYLKSVLPIRFGDIYEGMEMNAMLDIIQCYKETNDMDRCGQMFLDQNHSGMSASLVKILVKHFCNEELANYIYDYTPKK